MRDGLDNHFVRALAFTTASSGGTLFAATHGDGVFRIEIPVVSVKQRAAGGRHLELDQNYPNPFSRSTSISFSIPQAGSVRLAVYDLQGRLVRVLLSGLHPPGRRAITWTPEHLPAGTYYYLLETEVGRSSRALVVIR
jgi:hypothetical protein